MSKQYLDSRESKKLYFEQPESFEKNLCSYSFFNKVLSKPQKNEMGTINLSKGGVPLSYNVETESVYVDNSDSHTLVIGPTGSKKSRLIAMPTVKLLSYAKESMIISDPKAEIFTRTADQLMNDGYKISIINLREPINSECWNPLAIPYSFFCNGEIDKAYEFANDIAENLIHTQSSVKDPFWDNSSGSLFFGLILLLFKYCKEFGKSVNAVHIGNIIKLRNIMLSGDSIKIQNHPLWNYAKNDDFISSALRGTVEAPNNTRASILSVFDQKMRIFLIQPALVDMLSQNTISLDNIDKDPTAFFLILPDEKTSYHNLVSLFIKQSYEYLIFKAQNNNKKVNNKKVDNKKNVRVNYILDEFSSLPTIKDFPAMITASRSRNIRFNLFIQSKHQLLLRYSEEAETIQTNCNNWIFLTSRELRFLEEISELCGKTKDNAKPILSVAELQRLDKHSGEALILSGRMKPIICKLPDIDKYDNGKYIEHNCPTNRIDNLAETLGFELTQKTTKQNLVSTEMINRIKNLGAEVTENMDKKEVAENIQKRVDELKKNIKF